jgi:DNA-directed RNA polymerase subunit alpha
MPITVADPIDVRQLLRGSSFGSQEIAQLEKAIASPQAAEVRREVNALEAEVDSAGKASDTQLLRIGIAAYLLGLHNRAETYLSKLTGDSTGQFYYGQVLLSLGRNQEAGKAFEQAAKVGYDAVECTLRRVEALRSHGELDTAEELLRSVNKQAAGRAEYSYQYACILADRRDTYGALEYLERAVDMDPHHSRALFRLAAENALRGNDEEAIRLYEQSLSKPPFYQGALLNLGLLYEDAGNLGPALYCFRRILEVDPNHMRARLYIKDIEATSEMYYDEESIRNEARMQQLLGRPIADFELSVRSRNCLQAMGIYTLGDLTKKTEPELLEGKNFGETSLTEIRELMAAHGLRIGQHLQAAGPDFVSFHTHDVSPQEQMLLGKPISELNLSVRARKCMTRLGISTLAELVQRTADDLLASRNFGVTSLNEVRAKLQELSLKLRND